MHVTITTALLFALPLAKASTLPPASDVAAHDAPAARNLAPGLNLWTQQHQRRGFFGWLFGSNPDASGDDGADGDEGGVLEWITDTDDSESTTTESSSLSSSPSSSDAGTATAFAESFALSTDIPSSDDVSASDPSSDGAEATPTDGSDLPAPTEDAPTPAGDDPASAIPPLDGSGGPVGAGGIPPFDPLALFANLTGPLLELLNQSQSLALHLNDTVDDPSAMASSTAANFSAIVAQLSTLLNDTLTVIALDPPQFSSPNITRRQDDASSVDSTLSDTPEVDGDAASADATVGDGIANPTDAASADPTADPGMDVPADAGAETTVGDTPVPTDVPSDGTNAPADGEGDAPTADASGVPMGEAQNAIEVLQQLFASFAPIWEYLKAYPEQQQTAQPNVDLLSNIVGRLSPLMAVWADWRVLSSGSSESA